MQASYTGPVVSSPGVIAGAVLRAVRHSKGLTRAEVARRLAVSRVTVKRWERGTIPLFTVDYHSLRNLARVLGSTDSAGNLAELLIACQCDLLIAGMLSGQEDFADVPPIDEDTADGVLSRELLSWALAGQVPARYRNHAPAVPLITPAEAERVASIARYLAAGDRGELLAAYGTALLRQS